jgi:hypothetical protein
MNQQWAPNGGAGWVAGLAVLLSNGVAGESALVAGGHGMCCGVWPIDGFGE